VTVPGGGGPTPGGGTPPAEGDLVVRRPKLRDALRGEGARGALIATISTVALAVLIVVAVLRSPGWPAVRQAFFNWDAFIESFPDVLSGFWLNVQMFMIAEVLTLAFALVLAVLRSMRGPVFFPLRLIATGYTDFFRGIPTLLVVFILGLGMPALDLQGVPDSEVFWGVTALVLVYSAYVAEVYRAGIDSVHPSQRAAARSLGLGQWQSLRHVVLPQAVRRVIPPLLNDFVGLQKETVLVSVLGVREAGQEAAIVAYQDFNYTPFLAAALLFIVVTIPLARFTDLLIERDRRRRESRGG
jgi:polar amino acid transport system permease protein